MKELRFIKVKWLAQGHEVTGWIAIQAQVHLTPSSELPPTTKPLTLSQRSIWFQTLKGRLNVGQALMSRQKMVSQSQSVINKA